MLDLVFCIVSVQDMNGPCRTIGGGPVVVIRSTTVHIYKRTAKSDLVFMN